MNDIRIGGCPTCGHYGNDCKCERRPRVRSVHIDDMTTGDAICDLSGVIASIVTFELEGLKMPPGIDAKEAVRDWLTDLSRVLAWIKRSEHEAAIVIQTLARKDNENSHDARKMGHDWLAKHPEATNPMRTK